MLFTDSEFMKYSRVLDLNALTSEW